MNTTLLGQLLKTLRNRSNMNQQELAIKLGVTTSAISKWETGKNLPDIEKLTELSAIFNVPIEDLCHPEKTLLQLEKNNISTPSDTTPKSKKYKPLIILGSVLILSLTLLLILLFFINNNKESQSGAYPFASRMIEDELFGSIYEMAIVYNGDLNTLSDPTTDFMELVYSSWCNNTDVPPEIITMKVSFYETEEDASQWNESQKSTYFFR